MNNGVKGMKVGELKRLLGYFSDDITVCVQDHSIGDLAVIEDVRGVTEKPSGTFFVRLDIQCGKGNG